MPDAGGLFAAYSPQIFAYCLHNLGSRSDAEDALQTTFLQAHRALQRGVVPECESAWLTAIAKNACRWQRRTRARRATASEGEFDASAVPAPADDDARAVVADLKDALASIPERQRRALLLREWQGLQPTEIAPKLGASTSETYALLSRARRSVASALTAAARRPVLGLDFGSLLLQLRSLLASGPAAVGATAVVVAGVGLAGVTVERAVVDRDPAKPQPALVSWAPERGDPVRPAVHESGPRALGTRVSRSRRGPAQASPGRSRPSHAGTAAAPAPTPRSVRTQRRPGSLTTTLPAASSPAPAPAQPAPKGDSAPAPPPLAVPSLPDPTGPPPVDVPPPVPDAVTSAVSAATDVPPPPDGSPPPAPATPPPPLPQLLPPVHGLLP